MEGPSAILNVMTLPPGATKTQARLVLDGVRGAIFEYKNGGPVGALVGSWAMTAGHDPYGNPYNAGFNVASGGTIEALVTFAGIVYAVSLSAPVNTFPGLSIAGTGANAPNSGGGVGGQVDNSHAHTEYYSGTITPADVPAILDLRSQADSGITNGQATQRAGLITLGATSSVQIDDNAKQLILLGTSLLKAQAAPAAVTGFAEQYGNPNGTPSGQTANGFNGNFPLTKTDTATNTNANVVGVKQLSVAWPIPAGDMQAGTIYELEVPWNATMQSQTLQLGLSIDGSATFDTNDTIGGAIVGAGAAIRGWVKILFEVLTTGVTGTYNATLEGGVRISASNALAGAGSTGVPLVGGVIASGTIDTTVVHNLRLNSLWGAAAAGQTVSGYGSKFTRSGP